MLRLPKRSGRCGVWVAIAVLLAVALLFGIGACSDSTTVGVLPTTGILIRVETLTTGRGCGTGPTELYKYVVVVFGYDGPGNDPAARTSYNQPVTSNVFDCYVDGEFVALHPVNGSSTYRLEVYAYNAATFNTSADVIRGAGTDITRLRGTTPPPTYTTECTATQSSEVETLAQCEPLAAGLGGFGVAPNVTQIGLATQSFRLPDGRIGVCGKTPGAPGDAGASPDAGTDAGTDAGAVDSGVKDSGIKDASSDAVADGSADASEDAGIADAGGDAAEDAGPSLTGVFFTTVRVRARVGGTVVVPAVDIPCPTGFIHEVPAAPASYTLDVGLIDESGTPVGQTTCAATSQTGVVINAACP